MPQDRPTVGETWEFPDAYGRMTRGIVSDVAPTLVTLVALTGARIRVPAGRFPNQWQYAAGPPITSILCHCGRPGILRFQRGTTPDFRCPKHLPLGVLATLHTPGSPVTERAQRPKHVVQCPHCGNADPVEDERIVHIGALEQGETGWWTCTLCSARWGLIAEPTNGTDDRTRWYYEALCDLYNTMLEHNVDLTQIEMSRAAWNALAGANLEGLVFTEENPDSGQTVAHLFDVPVQMVPSLITGAILLRARNAPPGSAVAPGRSRPVQKIGGVGGRSGVAGEGDGRPRGQTILGALGRLYDQDLISRQTLLDVAGVRPEPPPPVPTPTPQRVPLESVSKAVQDRRMPRVGDRFTSRRTGKTIDIARVEEHDGVWAVAIQESSYNDGALPNAPMVMWANDFLLEYIPYGAGKGHRIEPLPVINPDIHVAVGEEWYSSENSEYVTIESLDYRKMRAAGRGASTGKLRQIPLDDFLNEAKCKLVVRTSAHQRLMGDDDY